MAGKRNKHGQLYPSERRKKWRKKKKIQVTVAVDDVEMVETKVETPPPIDNDEEEVAMESTEKSRRKYRYCVVPMCRSTEVKTPMKRYFAIPNEEKIRNLWLHSMRRRDNITYGLVCEDHFDLENDLENYIRFKYHDTKTKHKLKKDVVPHIFACQNKSVKIKRNQNQSENGFNDSTKVYHKIETSLTNEVIETNLATCDFVKEETHVIIKEEPWDLNFEIGEERPDIDYETEENPICDVPYEIIIKKEPIEDYNNQTNKSSNDENSESIANKFNKTGEKDCKIIDNLLSYINAEVSKNLQKLSAEKRTVFISSMSDMMNEFMKNNV